MSVLRFDFWENNHPRINEAMEIEYSVFLKAGYIEPNRDRRAIEYDKYPDFRFLVGLDGSRIVAAARNIFDRDNTATLNFPTANDFDIFPEYIDKILSIGKDSFCETGTLAVIPEYQGNNYSINMMDALIKEYNAKNIYYTICAIDEGFFDFLKKIKLPFERIGKTQFYMGSPTVPALFDSKTLEPDFFSKLLG